MNTSYNYDDELYRAKEKLALYSARGKELSKEINALRSRKNFKLLSLLLGGQEQKTSLPKDLYPLYDYSIQYYPDLRSYKLRETNDLALTGTIEYPVVLPSHKVKGIFLSFSIDFFSDMGLVRVELQDKNANVIHWACNAIAKIVPYSATKFEFTNVQKDELPKRNLLLKISAENTDIPVRVREWQRLNILRGKVERVPFLGFVSA